MIIKNELKVLEYLTKNLTLQPTIRQLSKDLKQHYSQVYSTIMGLEKKNIVHIEEKGKAKLVTINLKEENNAVIITEIEKKELLKNKKIKIILDRLNYIKYYFVAILFGSYAKLTETAQSDVDILFIIPSETDMEKFNRIVKNELSIYNVDVNTVFESEFLEMLKSNKLNVANEILKNHIILKNAEEFVNILRRWKNE